MLESHRQKYDETDTDFYGAVLPAGLQPQDSQCLWYNHPLLPVVWWGNTLKELETLKGSSTPSTLVRRHSTDSPVKDLRWCAVMERARLFGVDNVAFV